MPVAVPIDETQLSAFCQRWRIQEIAAFGSVVRTDFQAGSDVDLLVSFLPDARWSLLDEVRMEEELTELFGRPVDLVSRRAVEASENWIRRRAILSSAVSLYSAT